MILNKMSQNVENLRVKELRGFMSLRDFAEPLGVSGDSISKIETGKIGLSTEMAKKICKVYNVSMAWLFGETEDRLPSTSNTITTIQEPTVDYKTKYIEALETINALQNEKLKESEIRQTALEK